MSKKLAIAMFGQKRLSREGGVEIVVKELCTRMAQNGCDVTCYNRAGHHVSGAEYDDAGKTEYEGIRQKSVPTIEKKGLAAVSSSFFAALCSAFGRYDVVHIHAEGPAFFAWLPKMFGKRVVVTVHGIDWQREKWQSGLGSKFIHQGEKNAAKYADEVIVLSKGVQDYLHVTTTPSVAYIARVDDFDCGIMISASHNPYYDNGIKLIDCYGEKMPEEILLLVEDYIDGKLHVFDKDWPELPFAHREHIGCTVDYVAGRNRYMGYLISLGIYSFKGVKVGLDCANGSSWNIAKSVFDALGADTYVINNKPNGLNINNNAGSTHIEGLQKFVVEKGLDIGFAYDGDADRCLCVDEKGNVITGDHILYIYGCYMKERGKLLTNTVVTTVMSNFGLYKAFDEKGIGYAKTAVGDKYVYEYMAKNGCRIGGEQSGHIIFSKYASTGDGILTSLKMMEVMLAKKKPMSELAAPLKIYPQVLENVRVTDKKATQNDPAVQEAVNTVAEALGDTGRILVRESGTEPVVRVMVEAPDHDTCQKYVDEVVNVICEKEYKA